MSTANDLPLFDALNTPHQSGSPSGLRIIAGMVVLSSAGLTALFWALGAWPVAGFMGGEVLLVIGLITPLSFLIQFRQSIVAQIKRFRLETPKPVYRLTFPAEGDTFLLQVTEQPEQTLAWRDLAGAYLTKRALYLYAAPRQAYIVPLSQLQAGEGATLWAMARQSVAQGKARAYTRRLPDAA